LPRRTEFIFIKGITARLRKILSPIFPKKSASFKKYFVARNPEKNNKKIFTITIF
jgi:hypothetical protein